MNNAKKHANGIAISNKHNVNCFSMLLVNVPKGMEIGINLDGVGLVETSDKFWGFCNIPFNNNSEDNNNDANNKKTNGLEAVLLYRVEEVLQLGCIFFKDVLFEKKLVILRFNGSIFESLKDEEEANRYALGFSRGDFIKGMVPCKNENNSEFSFGPLVCRVEKDNLIKANMLLYREFDFQTKVENIRTKFTNQLKQIRDSQSRITQANEGRFSFFLNVLFSNDYGCFISCLQMYFIGFFLIHNFHCLENWKFCIEILSHHCTKFGPTKHEEGILIVEVLMPQISLLVAGLTNGGQGGNSAVQEEDVLNFELLGDLREALGEILENIQAEEIKSKFGLFLNRTVFNNVNVVGDEISEEEKDMVVYDDDNGLTKYNLAVQDEAEEEEHHQIVNKKEEDLGIEKNNSSIKRMDWML